MLLNAGSLCLPLMLYQVSMPVTMCVLKSPKKIAGFVEPTLRRTFTLSTQWLVTYQELPHTDPWSQINSIK